MKYMLLLIIALAQGLGTFLCQKGLWFVICFVTETLNMPVNPDKCRLLEGSFSCGGSI